MSAYSTLTVSRKVALQSLLLALNNATNDQLADALFALVGEKSCYNFQVYDTDGEEDDRCLERMTDPNWG